MDLGISAPNHGDLLLSVSCSIAQCMLTVRAHEAASHRDIGWQQFTDYAVENLSKHHNHIVFMLWGRFVNKRNN